MTPADTFEADVERIIDLALKEDLGSGDITVGALVSDSTKAQAEIVAKEEGVLAGVDVAVKTFLMVDEKLAIETTSSDGDRLRPGDLVASVHGRAASLLKAERTALNFLQRLSGVATITNRYVEAVDGTGAVILDTRKTTPGLRLLEKAAVKAGGGVNHRVGLYDMVLVKDNHLAVLNCRSEAEAVKKAVAKVRSTVDSRIGLEVEVTCTEGALAAAAAGADMILLDNMSVEQLSDTVARVGAACGKNRPQLEASGGVSLETVRAIARTGVDRISVGALTHSVKALDIAMYLNFDKKKS